MDELIFWSGTPALSREREVISKAMTKWELKPLYTACFRLSPDLKLQDQVDAIKRSVVEVGYKEEFLDVYLINPIISDEYPIAKCCMYALINFERHPNE